MTSEGSPQGFLYHLGNVYDDTEEFCRTYGVGRIDSLNQLKSLVEGTLCGSILLVHAGNYGSGVEGYLTKLEERDWVVVLFKNQTHPKNEDKRHVYTWSEVKRCFPNIPPDSTSILPERQIPGAGMTTNIQLASVQCEHQVAIVLAAHDEPEKPAMLGRALCMHLSGVDSRYIDTQFTVMPLRMTMNNGEVYRTFCEVYVAISALVRQTDIMCGGTTIYAVGVDTANLNPLMDGAESLVAMLILALPECNWVFCIYDQTGWVTQDYSGALINHGARFCSLFDGGGIRQHVRATVRKDKQTESLAAYLPTRKELAATVDDEANYAYFHALAAYRFGFRVYPVTTEEDVRYLFKESMIDVDLTIEDLYLNFPDHDKDKVGFKDANGVTHDVHFSVMEERERALPRLALVKNRIFVTTGQRQPKGKGLAQLVHNRSWLIQMRAGLKVGHLCYKPTRGIFGLWIESGLLCKLRGGGKHRPRGYAENFVWPPELDGTSEHYGHSAPGRLLEISHRLLSRAENILKGSNGVLDSIRAAVLATDALELLGERTPTSALEALALKHLAEVTAGCQFYGTQFNLCISPRLKELRKEVSRVGNWFSPKTRDEACANAELGIVSGLATIFRNYSQYEEEQTCLARVRELHRKLWFSNHPLHWPAWPVQWYTDFLLESFPRFLMVIMAWIAGLGLLYGLCEGSLGSGIQHAVTSFLSIGQPYLGTTKDQVPDSVYSWPFFGVMTASLVGGVFHLGIFINHLYTIASRR